MLGHEVVGHGGPGTRVVLVHGFTQTGRCWGPVATDLARDHELVLVDAPGHGSSGGLDLPFADAAAAIGDVGGRATYVGYSMGGRLCLRLALDRPDLVDRLVLIGASPGLRDPGERAARRTADEALADHLVEIGIEAFIDEWLSLPLFAGLDAASSCRAERLQNTTAGLASSLRRAGTGAQEPVWSRLPTLALPTLLVTGREDVKFTAIAGEMLELIPRTASHRAIDGAGHTAHLEAPEAFLAELRAWLDADPL